MGEQSNLSALEQAMQYYQQTGTVPVQQQTTTTTGTSGYVQFDPNTGNLQTVTTTGTGGYTGMGISDLQKAMMEASGVKFEHQYEEEYKGAASLIVSHVQAWVERKSINPDNILYFMQDAPINLAAKAGQEFSQKYKSDQIPPIVLAAAREDMQIYFEEGGYSAFSENSTEFTRGEDYLKFDLHSSRHFFVVHVSPLFRKKYQECENLYVKHIYRMGGSEPAMAYYEIIQKEGYKFFRESGPAQDAFFPHLQEALLENKV